MAQLTKAVVQGIIAGQGYTDNEVRQLAHHFLAALEQPAVEPTDDNLRTAFAQCLTSTYVCCRVWSAWAYGTMCEDDFLPASECDELLDELVRTHKTIIGLSKPLSQAQQPVSDDLRDRLVAISSAIADQDDRAAQAMLREILSAPQAQQEKS